MTAKSTTGVIHDDVRRREPTYDALPRHDLDTHPSLLGKATHRVLSANAHRRLLFGLILGSLLGLAASALGGGSTWLRILIEYVTEPIGKIFIRALLMLVVPIVFSALVMGIAELDLKHLGRLGARTLGYTVCVSLIAVVIGLALVNWLRPGDTVTEELRSQARSAVQAAPKPPSSSAVDLIVNLVPSNPIGAAATGDMLGFVVFSLLFGIAVAVTKSEASLTLRKMIAGLFDVCMSLIDMVLKLAPIGVGCLMFVMTARTGVAVLIQLGAYVGVAVLGLSIHLFIVYGLSVRFLSGMSPIKFFSDIRLALATAFSTASSNATLPTALRVADENLKLPSHVSRFVLTAGATMNQNGTALFEGVTVLFLAQAHGVELDLGRQFIVMLICVLAGIGTAGVPAGSLPVIAMILGMLGIPPEGIGIVLGVDRFLDMCRTTVNVAGDLAAAVFVAKGESATEGEALPAEPSEAAES
jgi:DAACS family dicarboxylate/amino acid:cation (Na+ or H+) symporter